MEAHKVEAELLAHWFEHIGSKHGQYKEPIFDVLTVDLFKKICDLFEQTTNVFVMGIEVAEDYIRAKRRLKKKIRDPLLVAVTIIFICHKCEGASETIKIPQVIEVLSYLSERLYTRKEIAATESDVIAILHGALPVTTPLDDMYVIIERYMADPRLRGNIRPLCEKLLEFIYVERCNWFKEIKETYNENIDAAHVFQQLISSKFYVPVSILITAIKLSQYQHVMDVDSILADVQEQTHIHEDHIHILSNKFVSLI